MAGLKSWTNGGRNVSVIDEVARLSRLKRALGPLAAGRARRDVAWTIRPAPAMKAAQSEDQWIDSDRLPRSAENVYSVHYVTFLECEWSYALR